MTDQGRWTDLFIAIGVAFALLAGLMLVDVGLDVLQKHSMRIEPPPFPASPSRFFAIRSALAAEAHPRCWGNTNDFRSSTTKYHFFKTHPCPGGIDVLSEKRCRGYVIDHICPLECCGKDDPSNMQWQTIAEAKAKDKWEGQCSLSCPPSKH